MVGNASGDLNRSFWTRFHAKPIQAKKCAAKGSHRRAVGRATAPAPFRSKTGFAGKTSAGWEIDVENVSGALRKMAGAEKHGEEAYNGPGAGFLEFGAWQA